MLSTVYTIVTTSPFPNPNPNYQKCGFSAERVVRCCQGDKRNRKNKCIFSVLLPAKTFFIFLVILSITLLIHDSFFFFNMDERA